MAVTLDTSFVRYRALSTDVKPTDGVQPGASLLEADTGTTYFYDGLTWKVENAVAQAAALTTSPTALRTQQLLVWMLRELRLTTTLLAQSQGIPAAALPPLPEIDPFKVG